MNTIHKTGICFFTLILSICFSQQSVIAFDTLVASGEIHKFEFHNEATDSNEIVFEGSFRATITHETNIPIGFEWFNLERCFGLTEDGEIEYCTNDSRVGWRDAIERVQYEVFDINGNLILESAIQREVEANEAIVEFNRIINSETIYTFDPMGDFTDSSDSNWYIVKGSTADDSYEESVRFTWSSFGADSFMSDISVIQDSDDLNAAELGTFKAYLLNNESINFDLSGSITNLHELVDSDRDGYNDDVDACVNSVLNQTVVLNDNDSDVTNTLLDNGCTITDSINTLVTADQNHGDFISAVSIFLNGLISDGIISGSDKGAIQSSAAK